MVKRVAAVLVAAVALGCGGGGAGVGYPTLALRVLVAGLDQPMQYRACPTDRRLAYVLERRGVVRLLVDGTLQLAPVLDISAEVNTAGEGGLLGMAFDPAFGSNRYIYLHFSTGADLDTQVTRLTLAAGSRTAVPGSARSVFRWGQAPHQNHKGGSINFGADGLLYVALGDGGSGNDPDNRAQDPSTLFGKALRLDPHGDGFPADPLNNYAVPPGNPYPATPGVRPEIWATGLRNPFRWSFDPITGAMLLADVGQDGMEEVDYEPAGRGGRNYGWRVREGTLATGLVGPTFGSVFQAPWLTVPHPHGESVIGGFVYRGLGLGPAMQGRYLLADYVTNRLWSVAVTLDASGEAQGSVFGSLQDHTGALGLNGPVSLDQDADGEPVVTELNSGRVSRLVVVP